MQQSGPHRLRSSSTRTRVRARARVVVRTRVQFRTYYQRRRATRPKPEGGGVLSFTPGRLPGREPNAPEPRARGEEAEGHGSMANEQPAGPNSNAVDPRRRRPLVRQRQRPTQHEQPDPSSELHALRGIVSSDEAIDPSPSASSPRARDSGALGSQPGSRPGVKDRTPPPSGFGRVARRLW